MDSISDVENESPNPTSINKSSCFQFANKDKGFKKGEKWLQSFELPSKVNNHFNILKLGAIIEYHTWSELSELVQV